MSSIRLSVRICNCHIERFDRLALETHEKQADFSSLPMKWTRFAEGQSIGIMKEPEAGGEEKQEFCRQDVCSETPVLPLAVQLRWVNL